MSNSRNFTHNSNFLFQTNLFSEEDVIYAIQECNLPGMAFNHIEVGRRAIIGNVQGDTINYNPLDISIIVDEKLKTWKNIISIMQDMRDPEKSTSRSIQEYGFLIVQDDNTNTVVKVEFKGLMVESIGDLQFNTNSEDEIITCPISLRYDYYTIVE